MLHPWKDPETRAEAFAQRDEALRIAADPKTAQPEFYRALAEDFRQVADELAADTPEISPVEGHERVSGAEMPENASTPFLKPPSEF